MRFTAFEFQNFKGMESTTLDLTFKNADTRVATLVGLNESGKTTVLEGIDRFVAGRESEEIGPKHIGDWRPAEPFELVPISRRANFNEQISIRAHLALGEADKKAIIREVRASTGFRIETLVDEMSIVNRYVFKNSKYERSLTLWPNSFGHGKTEKGRTLREIRPQAGLKDVWNATVSAARELVPTVWYFPNFLFDFPDHINLTPSEDETASNKLYRSLFQDILDSVEPGLTVETHVVERARAADDASARSLRQLRLDVGREVTRSVVQAWNKLFDNTELNGKRVTVEVESNDDGEVYASFELEDADGVFAIRERSLGFRWFFVYLLLTTYRGRRPGQGSEIVFLFDEPASNLHTSAQEMLLDSLATLSQSARIIYTTHSQHLVNPAWLESTFVVANEGFDAARVSSQRAAYTNIKVERYASFASRNPSRSHYFQPVLDVLDYQPSKLELVPEVVMVEGKSDYYLLRYTQDVLMVGESALHFLPGTGSGTLDLPIQLYTAWGRKFLVLLDSDTAGKTARSRYSSRFGPTVGTRLVVLDEVSDGPRAIESLLPDEDLLAFQRVLEPDAVTTDKKAFARGLEHAFALKREVTLSEQAMARLSALIENLRDRMADLS